MAQLLQVDPTQWIIYGLDELIGASAREKTMRVRSQLLSYRCRFESRYNATHAWFRLITEQQVIEQLKAQKLSRPTLTTQQTWLM